MNRKLKASIFSLLFLSAVSIVAAAPQPPHEVYGTVTDGGQQAQGIAVEATGNGNTIVSDTTDSNGYYELKVPSNYSSFDILVDGTTKKQDISVQSGKIQEINFSGDYTGSGGNGLSVSVPDETVDEDESIDISPTVSNEGSNPSYSWSITGDDHGATLTDENQKTVTFEAPGDVSEDRDVELELKVTKSGGSSETDSGTVTVIDTTSQSGEDGTDSGSGGGTDQEDSTSGGGTVAPADNQSEQEQEELSQDQQNQTQPEPNIQTNSLNVKALDGTSSNEVTIEVTVENTGGTEGSQEVEVRLGDQIIKTENVSLGAGESKTLRYNHTVEQSGSLSFSSGNQSTTVEVSQKGNPLLPIAAGVLVVALLGAAGYTQRGAIKNKVEDFRK